MPRDCILYRYKNLPPPGAVSAAISLPIMPWNRTDSYSGRFVQFALSRQPDGSSSLDCGKPVTMADWPSVTPDAVGYTTSTIRAQAALVDPSNAVVRDGQESKPGED